MKSTPKTANRIERGVFRFRAARTTRFNSRFLFNDVVEIFDLTNSDRDVPISV